MEKTYGMQSTLVQKKKYTKNTHKYTKKNTYHQRKFSGKLAIYELLCSLTGIVVLAVVVVVVVVVVVEE